ncbi:Protein Aster-B [Coelomomyces lativittatus]|nr:Protein Aster-B [Coelomomyces lativittatus]KAJ1516707.1 Protein Aster-B [Coelomomyces lativittatus]
MSSQVPLSTNHQSPSTNQNALKSNPLSHSKKPLSPILTIPSPEIKTPTPSNPSVEVHVSDTTPTDLKIDPGDIFQSLTPVKETNHEEPDPPSSLKLTRVPEMAVSPVLLTSSTVNVAFTSTQTSENAFDPVQGTSSTQSSSGLATRVTTSVQSSLETVSFFSSDIHPHSFSLEVNKKARRLFLKFFSEFSSEDLVGTFPCTMLKQESWAGRLFYTNTHLCFSGKLGKKIAKVTILWSDVIRVHLKTIQPQDSPSTQLLGTDAILIMSVNSKYIFMPPTATESAYNDIVLTWNCALKAMTPTFPTTPFVLLTQEPEKARQAISSSTSRKSSLDNINLSLNASHRSSNTPLPHSLHSISAFSVMTHPGMAVPTLANPMPISMPTATTFIPEWSMKGPMSEDPVPTSMEATSSLITPPTSVFQSSVEKSPPVNLKASPPLPTSYPLNFNKKETPPSLKKKEDTESEMTTSLFFSPLDQVPTMIHSQENNPSPLLSPSEMILNRDKVDIKNENVPSKVSSSRTSVSQQTDELSNVYPVNCSCASYLKHIVFQEILPLNLSTFWDVMYSSSPTIFQEAHASRDTLDMVIHPWRDKVRTLKYRIMYTLPFKGKSFADCTETQTLIVKEKFHAVIDSTIESPGVPFGESFSPYTKVCALQLGPQQLLVISSLKIEFARKLFLESKIETGAVSNSIKFWKQVANKLKQLPPPNLPSPILSSPTLPLPPSAVSTLKHRSVSPSTSSVSATHHLQPKAPSMSATASFSPSTSFSSTSVLPHTPSPPKRSWVKSIYATSWTFVVSTVPHRLHPILQPVFHIVPMNLKLPLPSFSAYTFQPWFLWLTFCLAILNVTYLTFLIQQASKVSTFKLFPFTSSTTTLSPAFETWLQSIAQRLSHLQNEVQEVQSLMESQQNI